MRLKILCTLIAFLWSLGVPAQVQAPPPSPGPGTIIPGGQYRGPGDIVPPNGPLGGASNCLDVQPAACNVLAGGGVDAGCPDPAIAVELPVSMFWFEPEPWNGSWDCIEHPEGMYMGQVTRADLESACADARNTLAGPPLVDFVVAEAYMANLGALYVYPHVALREYCVTHLSHMGPDQAECNPNYDQPFSKPNLTQWPNTGGQPKTLAHFAIEATRVNYTTYYGFWDDPGTGELADYVTMNRHCAEDPDRGTQPDIDGGRFRFHCDCQEGALNLIDAANPGNEIPPGQIIYWFFGEP